MPLIQVPEFDSMDEQIDFLEGRCHATTKRRTRCANPIFYGQWFLGSQVSRGVSGYVIDASPEDYDRWIAGLCDLHYAKWVAGEKVEIAEILRARLERHT